MRHGQKPARVGLYVGDSIVMVRPRKRSWRTRFFRGLQRATDRLDRMLFQ